MQKSVATIMNEFEHNADKLFLYLSGKFKDAAHNLNRQNDENVFQQLGSQYTHTLKEQLVQIALELIEQYGEAVDHMSQLQQAITKRIELYVNEFGQQTKQL